MSTVFSSQTETTVRYKKRLTLEDVSEWDKFRKTLDTLPTDEIVPVEVTELRIKVVEERNCWYEVSVLLGVKRTRPVSGVDGG